MNKMVSTVEFEREIATTIPPMSRRDKLLRFASIVRASQRNFVIYSNLEQMPPAQWDQLCNAETAFGAAATDQVLKDAGLAGMSVGDAQRFFELSRDDLHAFSCDCGGTISNSQMADRIEAIANRR